VHGPTPLESANAVSRDVCFVFVCLFIVSEPETEMHLFHFFFLRQVRSHEVGHVVGHIATT